MPSEKRILEIISNETKEEICRLDIVTPEIFTNIFVTKAKEHNFENIQKSVAEYIQQEIANYLYLQQETSEKADKLTKTTSKAIEAIQGKDDTVLKEVLVETKSLKKELEKLKASLYKDELTGCYNRKWMYDHVVREKENSMRGRGVLALIDLNYFKLVNDTYGHVIGDKVLIFVATQLRKTKGSVVRYGGDEFLLFFDEEYRVEEVLQILKNLREDLLKKHLKAKDADFRISFSIGVSEFSDGDNIEEVVERADANMYDDKTEIKKRIPGIEVL